MLVKYTCKQLPVNQRFDRQISVYEKGGGVRRVGQWIWTGNCLEVCYMALIGVYSTMHLMDPNQTHVTYTVYTCTDHVLVAIGLLDKHYS